MGLLQQGTTLWNVQIDIYDVEQTTKQTNHVGSILDISI